MLVTLGTWTLGLVYSCVTVVYLIGFGCFPVLWVCIMLSGALLSWFHVIDYGLICLGVYY